MVQEKHLRESRAVLSRFGIFILVAVLAVAAYLLNNYLKNPPLKAGINPAPAGEITPYFPSALNIENITKPTESYTYLSPDSKVTQPVMVYQSNLSMNDALTKFRNYLNSNGWTITYDPKPGESLPHFYATKGNESVNITLSEQYAGIEVSIAYATAKP